MSQGIKILAEGAKKFKSEGDLINMRFFPRKKPTHKTSSNFNVRVSHLPRWDPAALLQAHEWASLLETKEYMEFRVTLLKSNNVIIKENSTNKLVQLTRANLIKFFRNLNYKFACKFVRAEFKCWNRHPKRKPPLKFSLVTSQQNVALKWLPVRKTWPHLGVILIILDRVQWPQWSQTTEAGVRHWGSMAGSGAGSGTGKLQFLPFQSLAGFLWQDYPGCIPGQENWGKTLKVWTTGIFRIFSLFSHRS